MIIILELGRLPGLSTLILACCVHFVEPCFVIATTNAVVCGCDLDGVQLSSSNTSLNRSLGQPNCDRDVVEREKDIVRLRLQKSVFGFKPPDLGVSLFESLREEVGLVWHELAPDVMLRLCCDS